MRHCESSLTTPVQRHFLFRTESFPSNEGRGYVLRKILRRGIRHGYMLGQENPFMSEMVYAVRDEMQSAYPELTESAPRVAKVVEAEERQFARALKTGLSAFDALVAEARKIAADQDASLPAFGSRFPSQPVIQGDKAFSLYETFGLPLDFMTETARDAGPRF